MACDHSLIMPPLTGIHKGGWTRRARIVVSAGTDSPGFSDWGNGVPRAACLDLRAGGVFASITVRDRPSLRRRGAELRRSVVESVPAQEALHDRDECALLLEEEGVSGVGINRELRFRNQRGEHVVVRDRIEAVNGAIGDEGRHSDA